MKYLPAINLWDSGVSSALANGQLKLQAGQWIYCGDKEHKSRFISINDIGYINAVHWNGSGSKQNKNFLFRARVARLQGLLDKGAIDHDQFKVFSHALKLV